MPAQDKTPNGRLKLQLTGTLLAHGAEWADGARKRIEDDLGEVIDRLAAAFQRAEEAAREQQSQLREREIQRRRRGEAAIDRLREAHYPAALERQAAAWERSHQLRPFVEALLAAAEDVPDADLRAVGLRQWARWAANYLENLDPIPRIDGPPPMPRITLEQFRDAYDDDSTVLSAFNDWLRSEEGRANSPRR